MRTTDWRAILELARRHAQGWYERLPERPIYALAGSEAILAALAGPVPEEPTAPERVIDELVAVAEPGLTTMPSGRFFGWVIGGGLPSAVAADWLTSAWDQNAGSAEGTPAAAAFEQVEIGRAHV